MPRAVCYNCYKKFQLPEFCEECEKAMGGDNKEKKLDELCNSNYCDKAFKAAEERIAKLEKFDGEHDVLHSLMLIRLSDVERQCTPVAMKELQSQITALSQQLKEQADKIDGNEQLRHTMSCQAFDRITALEKQLKKLDGDIVKLTEIAEIPCDHAKELEKKIDHLRIEVDNRTARGDQNNQKLIDMHNCFAEGTRQRFMSVELNQENALKKMGDTMIAQVDQNICTRLNAGGYATHQFVEAQIKKMADDTNFIANRQNGEIAALNGLLSMVNITNKDLINRVEALEATKPTGTGYGMQPVVAEEPKKKTGPKVAYHNSKKMTLCVIRHDDNYFFYRERGTKDDPLRDVYVVDDEHLNCIYTTRNPKKTPFGATCIKENAYVFVYKDGTEKIVCFY